MERNCKIEDLIHVYNKYILNAALLKEEEIIELIDEIKTFNKDLIIEGSQSGFFSEFLSLMIGKLKVELVMKNSLVQNNNLIGFLIGGKLKYAIVEEIFCLPEFKQKTLTLYMKIYEIGVTGKKNKRNRIIPYVISNDKIKEYEIYWIISIKESLVIYNYNSVINNIIQKVEKEKTSVRNFPLFYNYP